MKNFSLKCLISAFVLLCCMIIPVSANGSSEDASAENAQASGPVKLTFYTYNYSAAQKPGVDQLISEFQAANPDIEIEIIYTGTDYTAKIQADIAAGETPDIMQLVFDALDYGINNFGIQDLNSIADKGELEEHLAGFEPAALDVARYNGKLYGLPYTFSTPVLFYNVSLFEKAGLDPDNPPETWKEVEDYALKIKQNTESEGFAFGGTMIVDWLVQGLIKSNGGSVMSKDKKRITFGEPAAAEAVKMLSDMRKSGAYAEMDDTQAFEAISQQNLGMLLTTSAYQAYILAAANAGGWELRTAKMPAFEGKKAVPVNSGSALFICSGDPVKQQAAWKFVRFVTSERGYTIITTKMGYPPLRPAIVNDERYLKQWAEENPLVKPNLEQLAYVTKWESYPGNNWFQIETILMDALNKCLYSNVDVAKTMKAAQQQAQSLMP